MQRHFGILEIVMSDETKDAEMKRLEVGGKLVDTSRTEQPAWKKMGTVSQ